MNSLVSWSTVAATGPSVSAITTLAAPSSRNRRASRIANVVVVAAIEHGDIKSAHADLQCVVDTDHRAPGVRPFAGVRCRTCRTRGNHHDVSAGQIVAAGGSPETKRNTQPSTFGLQPRRERAQLGTTRKGSRPAEHATGAAFALEHDHIVASAGGRHSSLQASDPTADDSNASPVPGRRGRRLVLVARLRVDEAADRQSDDQLAPAGLHAADARPSFIGAAGGGLSYEIRVGEVGSNHADEVGGARPDQFVGLGKGSDPVRRDQRTVDDGAGAAQVVRQHHCWGARRRHGSQGCGVQTRRHRDVVEPLASERRHNVETLLPVGATLDLLEGIQAGPDDQLATNSVADGVDDVDDEAQSISRAPPYSSSRRLLHGERNW